MIIPNIVHPPRPLINSISFPNIPINLHHPAATTEHVFLLVGEISGYEILLYLEDGVTGGGARVLTASIRIRIKLLPLLRSVVSLTFILLPTPTPAPPLPPKRLLKIPLIIHASTRTQTVTNPA